MKKILFIAMAFASMFFASCMGDGYADPDNTIKVPRLLSVTIISRRRMSSQLHS